ncbi:MAG: hypothetical protein HYV13_02585 [Candidatus Doudnabacteria bacterium]|nr:hypothetical protein [Candidatus Doudnabacteria bacterium]
MVRAGGIKHVLLFLGERIHLIHDIMEGFSRPLWSFIFGKDGEGFPSFTAALSALLFRQQFEQTHRLLQRTIAGEFLKVHRLQEIADIAVVPHLFLGQDFDHLAAVFATNGSELLPTRSGGNRPETTRIPRWERFLDTATHRVAVA